MPARSLSGKRGMPTDFYRKEPPAMPQPTHAPLPRRILLIHTRYRLPGGEDAVFEAERAMLEQHGHTVTVYERSNGEAAGLLQKLLLPLRAVFSFKAMREVRALIRDNRIELVHVHNTLLVTSPSVLLACRKEGVPVVQTLHNFRLFCPNGVLLRQGKVCEDCPHQSLFCAVRHACYRGSRAESLVCAAVYAFHRLLGTYKKVSLITPTEFDRDKLLEFNALRPVFDPARLYVKPNPVSVTLPEGAPLPFAARKNQIVYAGRLEELKGLRTVLEAWRLLAGDPDAPRLLLVGDGPLEGWAREQALPNVEFAGRLPAKELHACMAESLAVVAASLCYESFALVPSEAHLVGTPVIASALGNVGASVTAGLDGLTFAPGDAADLARAVRALPAALAEMDPHAIRRASLEKTGDGNEENYRRLADIYARVSAGDAAR